MSKPRPDAGRSLVQFLPSQRMRIVPLPVEGGPLGPTSLLSTQWSVGSRRPSDRRVLSRSHARLPSHRSMQPMPERRLRRPAACRRIASVHQPHRPSPLLPRLRRPLANPKPCGTTSLLEQPATSGVVAEIAGLPGSVWSARIGPGSASCHGSASRWIEIIEAGGSSPDLVAGVS